MKKYYITNQERLENRKEGREKKNRRGNDDQMIVDVWVRWKGKWSTSMQRS